MGPHSPGRGRPTGSLSPPGLLHILKREGGLWLNTGPAIGFRFDSCMPCAPCDLGPLCLSLI